MRKLLIILMFCTLDVQAQDVYKYDAISTKTIQFTDNAWPDWEDYEWVEMAKMVISIKLDKGENTGRIHIYADSTLVYDLVRKIESKQKDAHKWRAEDGGGDVCTVVFGIGKSNYTHTLSIVYDEEAFAFSLVSR